MDRRQKQAALLFLNTVSLDGKPLESQDKAEDGARLSLPATVRKAASGEPDSSREQSGSQTISVKSSPLDSEHKSSLSTESQSKSCLNVVRRRSRGRIHFIKNMRQHDTRSRRIVLISARRALYGMFSVRPYRDFSQITDQTLDCGHQEISSGATKDTAALHYGSQCGLSQAYSLLFQTGIKRGFKGKNTDDYDPNLLDDPQWPCGKHKRVLVFPSYMTTVVEYVKPSDLKKDMNVTFSEKFPHVQLTLSKIRSLKREIRKLTQEDCGYEEPTIAMAYIYFEKLVLDGKLDKQNRKLCAGACILLAAKISNDLKRAEVKQLIDRLEERLRLNRRDLLSLEFPVLVALRFKLHLPQREILPHYRRLLQTA